MKRSWLWCGPVFALCACGAKAGSECPTPAEVASPQAVTAPLPDACAPLSGTVEKGWPPLQTSVPVYALSLSETDLAALDAHVSDRSFTVPGRFTFNGRTWDVTVRYRGRHTRYLPKKSFQIRFPDGDKFLGGVGRLELLAEYKDGGMLTEKLWYDLAYAANLEVPSTQYVELNLNGRLYGVMLEVEAITRPFLRAHGFDDDADIYRCGMFDCELRELPREAYQEPWEKRTNEDQSWDPLWALMQGLQRTSPNDFAAFVESQLDVDAYLSWLAVDAAIGNDTIGDSRSYLVRELDGRWTWVPCGRGVPAVPGQRPELGAHDADGGEVAGGGTLGPAKKSGSAPLEHRAAGLLQKYVEPAEVVGGNLLQLLFAYSGLGLLQSVCHRP